MDRYGDSDKCQKCGADGQIMQEFKICPLIMVQHLTCCGEKWINRIRLAEEDED